MPGVLKGESFLKNYEKKEIYLGSKLKLSIPFNFLSKEENLSRGKFADGQCLLREQLIIHGNTC